MFFVINSTPGEILTRTHLLTRQREIRLQHEKLGLVLAIHCVSKACVHPIIGTYLVHLRRPALVPLDFSLSKIGRHSLSDFWLSPTRNPLFWKNWVFQCMYPPRKNNFLLNRKVDRTTITSYNIPWYMLLTRFWVLLSSIVSQAVRITAT